MPALLLGALGIALAPIFVRLSEADPVATAFWRLALALPALYLWPSPPPTTLQPRHHRWLWLGGLSFAADLSLWHYAIHYTTIANATLFANVAPLFVTLICVFAFGQRFGPRFLFGLVLSLGGAFLLAGTGVQFSPDQFLGDAMSLLCAVFYAGYLISIAELRRDLPTLLIVRRASLISAGVLLAIALVLGERIFPYSLYGWAVVIGLGVISHAGGQSLIAFALAHLPVAFSALGLLLQPIGAVVIAWWLFDEQLMGWQWLGAVIILAGIYLARRA